MDIEQIVEQMPRAESPGVITTRWNDPRYMDRLAYQCFNRGCDAQCRLLAEKGYRKVPSEEEIYRNLYRVEATSDRIAFAAKLRKWLMGEQDG